MICAEASLAAKWILEERGSDRARALSRGIVRTGESIIATPLLVIEVTNILRQRMRAADGYGLPATYDAHYCPELDRGADHA